MAAYTFTGPVTDLPIGSVVTATDPHAVGQLGRRISGEGFEAILVRAAGAINDGAFCFVDPQAGSLDTAAATNTNAGALSATDRAGAVCGFFQGTAADNQLGWLVTRNANPDKGDLKALAGAAIAAGAQVTTTAVAGEIDDAAGVGTFDISNVSVDTDPGAQGTFTTLSWDNPKMAATAN